MGLFSRSTPKETFPWVDLTTEEQLQEILNTPEITFFLFKHSTRCSISSMAKQRLEREWKTPDYPFQLVYLDLLNFRDISNKMAELTGVEHQSPQLIVVKNGVVIYHNSHSAIQIAEAINL